MNNTEKCIAIFTHIQDAMEIAEELGNEKIFDLLNRTGYKIAGVLDKEAKYGSTEILTFNREELERALAYWYKHLDEHLEPDNEEENGAIWCAINTIRYCIEHDSGYQKGGKDNGSGN